MRLVFIEPLRRARALVSIRVFSFECLSVVVDHHLRRRPVADRVGAEGRTRVCLELCNEVGWWRSLGLNYNQCGV